MPAVDVLDDTFVRLDPPLLRARTGELWQVWLPDLRLQVHQDRGVKGVRWWVTGCAGDPAGSDPLGRAPAGGHLVGSAEVWLQRVPGGTVVHLYVRLDPAGVAAGEVDGSSWRSRRYRRRLPDRVRRAWKRELFRTTDAMTG